MEFPCLGRRMKIFLSWSGERSHAVANVFAEWLPEVIQSVTPWLACEHMAKGASWLQEVKDGVESSGGMGLFFLTAEAMDAPWLWFEAGGIAALEQKKVATVLVGIEQADVEPPLNIFAGTKLDKPDLLRLVRDINARLSQRLSEPLLEKTFERAWPEFEAKLRSALQGADAGAEDSESALPSFFAGDLASPMESSVEATAKAVQGVEARLGRIEEESLKFNARIVQQLGSLSALVQVAMSRVGSFAPAPMPMAAGFASHGGMVSGLLPALPETARTSAATLGDWTPAAIAPPALANGAHPPAAAAAVAPAPAPAPGKRSEKKKA